MAVHKYFFMMQDNCITTYRYKNNKFETVKFHGEEKYIGSELTKFYEWIGKLASIAQEDYIDFCFLSDKDSDSPLFEYSTKEVSSWSKKEIESFCHVMLSLDNFIIVLEDGNKSFVCQKSNCNDKDSAKKLFVKCIPPFSGEIDEKAGESINTGNNSILYEYYSKRIKEL